LALYVEVTNNHSGVVGRAGYLFDPGQTKTVKVAASRANELLDAPFLDTNIVSADSFSEVPKGYEVDANATKAAKECAKDIGVDILAVQGTGRGGQVTKDDVERHAKSAGAVAKEDRDHYLELHKAGGGSATVTTLDPLDAQLAAQHEALEELQRREAELRSRDVDDAEAGGSAPPSQTADSALPGESPSPPADVERSEEVQVNQPGSQPPKET
jgi:pyruvate/2-oxoglutarate dehydrogenase complex dihydrolipoamide acyltransferase (E2) component